MKVLMLALSLMLVSCGPQTKSITLEGKDGEDGEDEDEDEISSQGCDLKFSPNQASNGRKYTLTCGELSVTFTADKQ